MRACEPTTPEWRRQEVNDQILLPYLSYVNQNEKRKQGRVNMFTLLWLQFKNSITCTSFTVLTKYNTAHQYPLLQCGGYS